MFSIIRNSTKANNQHLNVIRKADLDRQYAERQAIARNAGDSHRSNVESMSVSERLAYYRSIESK